MLYRNQHTPYSQSALNNRKRSDNFKDDYINQIKNEVSSVENRMNTSSINNNFIEETNNSIREIYNRLNDLSLRDKGVNYNKFDFNKDNNKVERFLMELVGSTENDLNRFSKNRENKLELVDYSHKNNKITSKLNKFEYYNINWEEEFRREGLSLEDDGIYEYIDGDDKMKYEYFNGELPKTKIVKLGSKLENSAEVKSGEKIITDELGYLRSESAIVQKAWLENNKKIVELTDIIELQEKEIRKLKNNDGSFSSNVDQKDISSLEERIKNLEKIGSIGISAEDNAILEKLKTENKKLKDLILEKDNSGTVEEAMVKPSISEEIREEMLIEETLNKKKKQAHFFVIKEHENPKITKFDIDHKIK